MVTETVMHIRLTSDDQAFLDECVEKGYFSNKSDALRTALRLYRFSVLEGQIRTATANQKQLSFDETMKSLKEIRRKIYQREWGHKRD